MKNNILLSILMLFSLEALSSEIVSFPNEHSVLIIEDIEVWVTRPCYSSNNCNIFKVIHSIGFVYALRMVSFHRDKIKPGQNGHRFGKFYILAPENACSAPTFPISDFEEIWQYGTVEANEPNPHKTYENDGVEPQCGVKGLNWDNPDYARIGFPVNSDKLNFFDAHSIINYDWIFKIFLNRIGYVKSRK